VVISDLVQHSGIGRPWRHRFVKFGLVGLSGTVVNQAVLYAAYEFLFASVDTQRLRLTLSLSVAIFLATISNFILNRTWTWGDRRSRIHTHFFIQLGQYFLACWLAIVLQFVFTHLLVRFFRYLVANLISIGLAAVINYVINDAWTFAVCKTTVWKNKPVKPAEKEVESG